ncbi:MAG TPA: zf-HC2 domain-containing protein [Terriglobia bacterium]|nr:zf-HC2 domain-containing protein [Terriglobia bacterium]
MSCVTDGLLRARIDGELTETESFEVTSHLAVCADCRRRAETVAIEARRVSEALSTLAPQPGEAPPDAALALAQFRATGQQRVGTETRARTAGIIGRLFAKPLRPAWAAAAAILLGVGLFSLAPARSWAQRVLAMLRVQQVAVIGVDPVAMPGPDSNAAKTISAFFSDNVVQTLSSQPQSPASADEASRMAGYPVRLLSGRADAPQFTVEGEQAFNMTLNRDRLQAILSDVGRPDLQFPAAVDGAMIAVHIPSVVVARYGNCPNPADAAQRRRRRDSAAEQAPDNCLVFVQAPSPVVSVPPDLNIAQLAVVALQAAGMSADEAEAFCQTVDWTSTLVIPVPRNAGSYEKVAVDGEQGTLIHRVTQQPNVEDFTLIWVKNGMIYSIAGVGEPSQAVSLANSLH